MGRRLARLEDLIFTKPKYLQCALSINKIIPWLKEKISSSELKMIVMMKEDFAKEVGLDVSKVESIGFYQDLKFVLLVHKIALKNGVHNSGKKLFIMRDITYKDKMPKYWKKRSKLFKKLMKSDQWKIMLKKEDYDRNDGNL